jgi:hypothetical protein
LASSWSNRLGIGIELDPRKSGTEGNGVSESAMMVNPWGRL